MLRSLLITGAACALTVAASGDGDGRALFEQAAEATKKVGSITYEARARGEGLLSIMPKVESRVWVLRVGEEGPWLVRCEGSGKEGGKEPLSVVYTSDGRVISWLDDEGRKLMRRPATEKRVGLPVSYARECVAPEMIPPEPFLAEIEAQDEDYELGEPAEVLGEMCDVVTVKPKGAAQRVRWYFSRTDHLPRKFERLLEGQGLTGARITEITNLKVGVEITPERFDIEMPEGYTLDERLPANPSAKPEPSQAKPADVKTATPKPVEIGLDVGNRAPDFELTTPNGDKVSIEALRGKVTVLMFWGSWSYQCTKAASELQKIYDQFQEQPVAMYALAVREDDPQNAIDEFARLGLTFGLLLNADDVATKTYKVRQYPTFYVLDRGGRIVHKSTETSAESFEKLAAVVQRYAGRNEGVAGPAGRREPGAGAGG